MNTGTPTGPSVAPAREPVFWHDGSFLPLGQVRVSPMDRGLLYGDGLFETLRGQDGRPLHLEDHLARLESSARALRLGLPAGLDWSGILADLLAQNGLASGPARLKIVLTRGQTMELGLPPATAPTLLISAQAYVPPSPRQYEAGWELHTFRQGQAPSLAVHKSLSYLFYLWARQEAQEAGCHEALVLGPQGLVCETAMGSLLCHDRRGWWTPAGRPRLAGVTLARARRLLAAQGQEVAERPCRPEEMAACPTVWVLNSLMGVMPARSLDGWPLGDPQPGPAAEMRARLLVVD